MYILYIMYNVYVKMYNDLYYTEMYNIYLLGTNTILNY